jgi:hypothetical protein
VGRIQSISPAEIHWREKGFVHGVHEGYAGGTRCLLGHFGPDHRYVPLWEVSYDHIHVHREESREDSSGQVI